jgi:hypothetical protein
MSETNLESAVRTIVQRANTLRLKHASKFDAHVSYCAIFCQDDRQFDSINTAASGIGVLADDTPTGPVYVVPPIDTVVGPLRVVKVRKPDTTRPEKGDTDFGVANYAEFKAANIGRPGFKLIVRPNFEMIELMDPDFDVRAYFSHPPVEEHSGIKETLQGSRK